MHFGNMLEEFMILIIDNDTHRLSISNQHFTNIALAGASLLELMLQGRITIGKDGILLVDETLTGDDLIDPVLTMIKEEPDEMLTVLNWIRKLHSEEFDLMGEVLDYLEGKNIIECYTTRSFLIFPVRRYKILDSQLQAQLKKLLHDKVTESKEIEPRIIGLLSLLYSTNSATKVFPVEQLEGYMDQIRGMVSGEDIGVSVAQSIWDITDAMMRTYITHTYVY